MTAMTEELASAELIDALVRRELAWPDLLKLMREPKHADRFDHAVAAWQSMVEWHEPILLPLAENLFIVSKDNRAIVKTRAGAELCAWNENWKMKCRIRVRRTREEMLEVFPDQHFNIDTDLVEIREFYCPLSGDLLDVDCVPPAYPVETDFTPDLEAFYRDWLGRDLPVTL
jgi:acetone carboxylase gamma subunit